MPLLVEQRSFPECALVKGGGQSGKGFADEMEEEPGGEQSERALKKWNGPGEQRPFEQRHRSQFAKAPRANDAVLVLSNAFAAEKVPAFGAAGDRFAIEMVETTLQRELVHEMIRGGAFGSSAMKAGFFAAPPAAG